MEQPISLPLAPVIMGQPRQITHLRFIADGYYGDSAWALHWTVRFVSLEVFHSRLRYFVLLSHSVLLPECVDSKGTQPNADV